MDPRPPVSMPAGHAVRRVVTGVNAAGKSTVLEDAACGNVTTMRGIPDFRLTEVWKTARTPADTSAADLCAGTVVLEPLAGGTTLRVVEFPPDAHWHGRTSGADAFSALGAAARESIDTQSSRHAMMHSTRTLDYIIVLKGEIWAVMDEGETCLRAGDILVQRGTNHAWSVRTPEPCVIAAVLIDAIPPQPRQT